MKFRGKAAVVTGAAQGIGAAIATRLAQEGARVLALDVNEETLTAMVNALPNADQHMARAVNIADSKAIAAALRDAHTAFGGLDFAVNNAGIGRAEGDGSDQFYEAMGQRNTQLANGETPSVFVDHLIHMEDRGWQAVMDVNLNGPFYVCRELVRLLAQDNKGGAIVNISSTSAQSGEGSPHYVTSKTALVGLTRQLARELAPRKIRVNAVAPGPTDTPIMQGIPAEWITSMEAAIPLGRMANPAEIASAVAYLLSDDASYVTGSVLVANGGSYYF